MPGSDDDAHLDWLPEYDAAARSRINALLSQIGANPNLGGTDRLNIWVAEHRIRAERRATERLTAATDSLRQTTNDTADELTRVTKESSDRLTKATWALMTATTVLALTTIALVVATVMHG
jgi:hypothetical protein